jgi:hypothetical protein
MQHQRGNRPHLPAKRTLPPVLFAVKLFRFAAMKQMLPVATFNWLEEREKTARQSAVSKFLSKCFTSVNDQSSAGNMRKKIKNIYPLIGETDK